MLSILDPALDRHTLDRRSTFLTAAGVALLILPLAALRPFEQPATAQTTGRTTADKPLAQTSSSTSTSASSYNCDSADLNARSHTTSTHISVDDEPEEGVRSLSYMVSGPGRCAEASMTGLAKFSVDETRLLSLPPGAFVRFRERLPGMDRSFVAVPGPNGGPSYVARLNGRAVDFDAAMSGWLAGLIPEVMREAAVNVPQRVTRLRSAGGVGGALRAIAGIRSTSAKTAHYKALLETDDFTQTQIDAIARSAGEQLASSPSDLRSVLDLMLPQRKIARAGRAENSGRDTRSVYPSAAAKASIGQSIQSAFRDAKSSGDKASILTQYAAGGDPDAVLMALRGAKDLTSDGDKANLLKTVAATALTARNPALRRAFFNAFETLSSDGDSRSVLTAAIPYGHANPAITLDVIESTRHISSDNDKAEVLIALTKQRLLSSAAIRDAFLSAAKQISSSADYKRVLQAAIEQ